MFKSPQRRVRVSASIGGNEEIRRLVVGLVALLALAALFSGLTQLSSAQGNGNGRSDVLVRKADKLLKRVVQAADEDRVKAAHGSLHRDNSEVERLSRTAGVERRNNKQVMVDVVVKLKEHSDEELKAAGFNVAARVGDVATVQVDVERLTNLASLESVSKIFAAAQRHPFNDRARKNVGVENVDGQRLVSQTGRGVIVAVIDSGIDFRHLDFTVPGSGGRQTRIKALLDMTVYGSQSPDPGWNYSLPGQTALIGHLSTEADINATK